MTGFEPLRNTPGDLLDDEQKPGFVLTAETAAEVAALADYPALAHLLGPEHFASLAHQAAERAEREGLEPNALVHSLLVRRSTPLPDDVPSRMAADVAAVEREICVVGQLAPQCAELPRVSVGVLENLDHETLRATRLVPIRALGIVPVGYRVDGFVRRVRAGKLPPPPVRQAQSVVVHALGSVQPIAWTRAVSHAEGRMLTLLSLGTALGATLDECTGSDGFPTQADALAALDIWLREDLFTRVISGNREPASDP